MFALLTPTILVNSESVAGEHFKMFKISKRFGLDISLYISELRSYTSFLKGENGLFMEKYIKKIIRMSTIIDI